MPAIEPAPGAPIRRNEVLGLDVCLDRGALRLRDPVKGEDLLSHEEAIAAHRRADTAREAAEAKVAELRARLRALGG